jgi:DNA-binding Xre family transcriptional regulator
MLLDNIKEICHSRNINYDNLIKELGYNDNQLIRWDEEESITLKDLMRISIVLKVDPNVFIGAKDAKVKQQSDIILLQYINCMTPDEISELNSICTKIGTA